MSTTQPRGAPVVRRLPRRRRLPRPYVTQVPLAPRPDPAPVLDARDGGAARSDLQGSAEGVASPVVLARVVAGLRALPAEPAARQGSAPEDLAAALAPLVRQLLAEYPHLGAPPEQWAPSPDAITTQAMPAVGRVSVR